MTANEFIKKKEKEWQGSNTVRTKNISRTYKVLWVREAFTFMVQSNYPEKVFVIERLRKQSFIEGKPNTNDEIGAVEYRIGYYILGKIGRANGKWVWGQFCPLIPAGDLTKLFNKAKIDGTIIS